jgi:hypothetical protein
VALLLRWVVWRAPHEKPGIESSQFCSKKNGTPKNIKFIVQSTEFHNKETFKADNQRKLRWKLYPGPFKNILLRFG